MSQDEDRKLVNVISDLRKTEAELFDLGKKLYSSGDGNMYQVDLLAIGAMKRTAGNTEGFITLVESKNMSAARSLLRVQLDTFIRFSSIWLVANPNEFSAEVIAGHHIRKIKDASGQKMSDSYLVKTLSKDYPWLPDVYNKLCGYVHFSEQHLFNSVQNVDADEHTFTFNIGKEDAQYPEWSWVEAVDCFKESVDIFFYYLNSLIESKNSKFATNLCEVPCANNK